MCPLVYYCIQRSCGIFLKSGSFTLKSLLLFIDDDEVCYSRGTFVEKKGGGAETAGVSAIMYLDLDTYFYLCSSLRSCVGVDCAHMQLCDWYVELTNMVSRLRHTHRLSSSSIVVVSPSVLPTSQLPGQSHVTSKVRTANLQTSFYFLCKCYKLPNPNTFLTP
jgi:hypothetical protein